MPGGANTRAGTRNPLGQPGGVGALDQGLELIAQAAAIKALGCRGDAKDMAALVMFQHLGPGAGDGMVGLINDQQLEEANRDLVEPPGQGLDGCDLNRVAEVLAVAGGDDAVIAADSVERTAGLIDQLLAVHQDADAGAAHGSALGDVGEDHGLAATGREDEQRTAAAGLIGATDLGDGLLLVGAESDLHRPNGRG